jgi:hypothetical protein
MLAAAGAAIVTVTGAFAGTARAVIVHDCPGKVYAMRSARKSATRLLATAILLASAMLSPLMTSAAHATDLQSPFGGWFAGTSGGRAPGSLVSATDPVNLVLYDPNGNASGVFQAAIQASGNWSYNTCLNWSIDLRPASNQSWQSPITSYATDTSYNGGDWWVLPAPNTCGNSTRNHLRLWVSSDGKWAYVAASMEYNGCGVHCVASNGFNQGRNNLAGDVFYGLNNNGVNYNFSSPQPYSCPSNFAGIGCDGTVYYYDLS